jgi:hypothetical protein
VKSEQRFENALWGETKTRYGGWRERVFTYLQNVFLFFLVLSFHGWLYSFVHRLQRVKEPAFIVLQSEMHAVLNILIFYYFYPGANEGWMKAK